MSLNYRKILKRLNTVDSQAEVSGFEFINGQTSHIFPC